MVRWLVAVLILGSSAWAHDGPPGDQPRIDPVTDGALASAALGFSLLSQLIIGTGEISPQEAGDPRKLLLIDRHFAEDQKPERVGGSIIANGGAGIVGAWAIGASLWTGMDCGHRAGWVDITLYAESALFNWALANLAKIAVRRPRPRAYLDGSKPSDTDGALSFYSGHTAVTAGLATTATYLAFVRHPDSDLGWWVMFAGGVITTWVGIGRVLSRDHFPTDVIAGGLAGVGIGLLVPHLHMPDSARTWWVGPTGVDGIGVQGTF